MSNFKKINRKDIDLKKKKVYGKTLATGFLPSGGINSRY